VRLLRNHGRRPGLATFAGSHKHRIVAIKSLAAWLRWMGLLSRAEDPTLDLSVPQAKRPTPKTRAEHVYTVKDLEQAYRHIPNPTVRALYYVRVHTGLHETEIQRIAKGDCIIRRLKDQGAIEATVDVGRKTGDIHRQSIDKGTLAMLERLQALDGEWPTEKTLARNRDKAAKASGCQPVFVGFLRHTRITLAAQVGEVVLPEGADRRRSHGRNRRVARAPRRSDHPNPLPRHLTSRR